MRFRGHTSRSLDSKYRVMLPPDFRDAVLEQSAEGKLMLTNFDGCVTGYPMQVWENVETDFNRISHVSKKIRDLERFFFSGAVEVCLDKQGRILVPPHLRQYASLKKEVVLVGVVKKFEIWDLGLFESKRQQVEANFDQVMDDLADQGIELRI